MDLFGNEKQRIQAFTDAVTGLGSIVSGKPNEGRWIKIQLPQGINLDLFIPQVHDYYRIYAIRTGSADYSHQIIAKAWERKGWAGTKDGLRLQAECIRLEKTWNCIFQKPTLPPVWKSDADFFDWLSIPHLPPAQREVTAPAYNHFLSK